ncbi:hypothetical protein ACFLR1_04750 [Bacteroidota bacterium]
MAKTFTLPQNLRTETKALSELEPYELLWQSELLTLLSEELEEVSYSPDSSVIKRVLAYSKAVQVKNSSTMVNGHVMLMN